MRITRRLAALSVLGAAGGLTAGAWAQCPATTCEGDHCIVDETVEAPLDIKAGSCPNAFNRKSNGKLPVALVGTDAFDVMMVDFWSLEISRADGMGGSLAPLGDHGPKYDDVATPFDGEGCECHEMYGDGITDLKMRFSRSDLVEMLELHDFEPGDDVELTLTGMLTDGTEFYANDCLWLVPAGDASLDGIVDTTDLLMVLSSWGPCFADNANVIECPADLDGNDAVGLEDLLLVLGDWGAGL